MVESQGGGDFPKDELELVRDGLRLWNEDTHLQDNQLADGSGLILGYRELIPQQRVQGNTQLLSTVFTLVHYIVNSAEEPLAHILECAPSA